MLFGRAKSLREVGAGTTGVGFVAQRSPAQEDPGPDDLFDVGTAAVIVKMLKNTDGSLRVIVQGIRRFRIASFAEIDPSLRATVHPLDDVTGEDEELRRTPAEFGYFVASNLEIGIADQQVLLEITNVNERLRTIAGILAREMKSLGLH